MEQNIIEGTGNTSVILYSTCIFPNDKETFHKSIFGLEHQVSFICYSPQLPPSPIPCCAVSCRNGPTHKYSASTDECFFPRMFSLCVVCWKGIRRFGLVTRRIVNNGDARIGTCVSMNRLTILFHMTVMKWPVLVMHACNIRLYSEHFTHIQFVQNVESLFSIFKMLVTNIVLCIQCCHSICLEMRVYP